jgi:hypothetical protein
MHKYYCLHGEASYALRQRKAFKDLWFLFDFFLVIMMVSETWIVPVFVLIMDSTLT